MILYSETLTVPELETIAAELGMRLFNADADFHGARKRRIQFLIRPDGTDRGEAYRARARGRRIFAVSWDGHYAFMSRVFAADPAAAIRTTITRWDGLADFLQRAPLLGDPSAQLDYRTARAAVGERY